MRWSNLIMNVSSWMKSINSIDHIFHQYIKLYHIPWKIMLSSMLNHQRQIAVYWLKNDDLRMGVYEWVIGRNSIVIDNFMEIWRIKFVNILICEYLVLDIEKGLIWKIFEIPNNHAEIFFLFSSKIECSIAV